MSTATENTVQADVGPGDKTGIYYITICNLPFGTSWQQLKDWTRTACVVDHIEVFQGSTSGWVRVRGQENFEKAWGLINGGVFNGRSIIASDKNRKESIKIKELTSKPQSASSQTPRYNPTPPSQYVLPAPVAASPQYTAASGQYYMANYPQASGPRFASQTIPPQGYAQSHQSSITAATTAPATYAPVGSRGYYTYDEANTRVSPVKADVVAYSPQYQYEGTQFALPYRAHGEHSGYYPDCGFSENEPSYRSEYVVTEPRKLHVSPFPQQARSDEVKSWIRRKVDKGKIQSMEIPKNSNSRYLRGYVLVIFDSASAANTAMEQLNKSRFQGRRVIARHTVEGVAADEPSDSHEASTSWAESKSSETHIPTGPSRSKDDDRRKNERSQRPKNNSSKKKPSEKKSSSSSKKTSQSQSQSDKKPSSKEQSTDEKSSNKDEGPVIVDGTSHSRDKS
ncbi:hypothetical protein FSARC_11092 [Fusarium sarcochroum]|uniref:RRM domain-containing protein n=1 Tax=Fusarium sarcochroum TaxID=1208366 RepID=A0A8H4X107_9HYPO|nr:hypothetical protein FSARC_11092 [Fusarium sarcochroum]